VLIVKRANLIFARTNAIQTVGDTTHDEIAFVSAGRRYRLSYFSPCQGVPTGIEYCFCTTQWLALKRSKRIDFRPNQKYCRWTNTSFVPPQSLVQRALDRVCIVFMYLHYKYDSPASCMITPVKHQHLMLQLYFRIVCAKYRETFKMWSFVRKLKKSSWKCIWMFCLCSMYC